MATSLNALIAFRVLQGLAGGGLQPSSQGILLDAFPPEKQGAAMTLFGIAALLAPVVGPTLGGYITDNYGWRWIFYLNCRSGCSRCSCAARVVADPDYLKAERAKLRRQHRRFDTLGPVPAERDDGLLGSRAEQRPGMGLVRRSVLPRADAGVAVRRCAWPA